MVSRIPPTDMPVICAHRTRECTEYAVLTHIGDGKTKINILTTKVNKMCGDMDVNYKVGVAARRVIKLLKGFGYFL